MNTGIVRIDSLAGYCRSYFHVIGACFLTYERCQAECHRRRCEVDEISRERLAELAPLRIAAHAPPRGIDPQRDLAVRHDLDRLLIARWTASVVRAILCSTCPIAQSF